MVRETWFTVLVLSTGWTAGWFLAKVSADGVALGPAAIAVSLAAVAAPAVLSFLLSEPPYRQELRSQLRRWPGVRAYAVAIAFPVGLAVAGRLAMVATAHAPLSLVPDARFWGQAVAFLPITLLWGLLEEIGWRGFLTARLARRIPALSASLYVGALWGLWHAPQIFFSDMPAEGMFRATPWTGAAIWIAACIAYGGVLGWLQLSTASCLASAFCHALINIAGLIVDKDGLKAANPAWAGVGGLIATTAAMLGAIALFSFSPPKEEKCSGSK